MRLLFLVAEVTRSLSNLYKGFTVTMGKQDRVIDCNELISEKVVMVQRPVMTDEFSSDGFTVGFGPISVDEITGDDTHIIGNHTEDIETVIEEKVSKKEIIIAEAQAEADSIVEQANADANAIIAAAQAEAQRLKEQAYNEGLSEGMAQAEANVQSTIMNKEQEFKALEQELYATYRAKEEKMEPQLVETILKIFADFTNAIALDKKDMILTLVNNVMSGGEVGSNFIIRACQEDAEYLREHKDDIVGAVRKDVHIEIVTDMSMKKNQCLIDTDMGIFDCSLDVLLENLITDLKILSATT